MPSRTTWRRGRRRTRFAPRRWPCRRWTGIAQPINAVAVTLQAMGRYDEARVRYEAALERARAIAPSTVPFLLANLSNLTGSMGHYAEALVLMDEALKRDPETQYLARRLQ